jgi:acyl carrier protein
MSSISTLKSAFATGLGVDEADIEWGVLSYRSIPEWDSVAHMQLVAEIEDAFDIMIDTDDVIAMADFEITRKIVEKYGVVFDEP